MKRFVKTIPIITTRGYYDLGTGRKLKNNSYYLYPKKSFKNLYGKKEITIMIHGLRNNKAAATNKFVIAKRRLKKLGYHYPVIGYSYDSNTKGAHIKKNRAQSFTSRPKNCKTKWIQSGPVYHRF